MQSRRNVTVAAVIGATQIFSLTVATDLLGADVSTYANQSATIETVGPEPETSEGEGWAALELGAIELPDQLAVADPDVGTEDEELPEESQASDDEEQAVPAPPTTQPATPPSTETTVTTVTVTPETTPTTAPSASANEGAGTSDPSSVDASSVDAGVTGTETRESSTSSTVPSAELTTPTTDPTETTTRTTDDPDGSPETPVSTSIPAAATTPATTVPSTTTTTVPVAPPSTRSSSTTTTTTRPTSSSTTTTATTTTTTTTATSTSTTTTTTTAAPSTTTTRQPTTTAQPTTTVRPTTTVAPTTAPPATAAPSNDGLESMRNRDPRFTRYSGTSSNQLSVSQLTEPAPVRDNGTVGDGQFRAACQYSHFAYDDPIVYPNQPGRSHLHMFFGNTSTDAYTTTNSLVNSGGGSCNGFELNRSGYWTPALLDGRGNAVVPEMIILYYKTKSPNQVQRMPQGLKMISGNATAESFTVSDFLYWSCGDSGHSYNRSNRIPDCGGDTINATIAFPQCWDGRNMDSADHRSHMALVSPHASCPSTHPVRLPQISILMYFDGDQWTKDWHLSSDRGGSFNTGSGATLHADWWGGWNDETMDLWTDGCMKAARNCSFGQTGTDRQLAKLNNFQNFPGEKFIPLP